jgi:hypothetical protein
MAGATITEADRNSYPYRPRKALSIIDGLVNPLATDDEEWTERWRHQARDFLAEEEARQ